MPLVDMRLAVSIEQPSFDIFTVVIVLKILNHGKIGLVVDGVMDVVNLADHDVYPIAARESHPALAPDCVTGVATYQGRSLMLLDLQKLFHDTIFEKIGETRGDRATSHAFRFQGVSTRSGQALLAS
jgi:chemotaxis signal transduction protein